MKYLTVLGRNVDAVTSYLYEGHSVITPVINVYPYGQMVIVRSDVSDYNVQYQADRLSSGLFGVVVHDTLEEAEVRVEEFKE